MRDESRGLSELSAIRMGGPGSGPHPGGGGNDDHETGKTAAATAMAKAGNWMAGKGGSTHATPEGLAQAAQGAHEHLTSQGLVRGKSEAVFGSPGGSKTGYYAKGQENNPYASPKVTVETGHNLTGDNKHWMSINAHK